MGIAAVSRAGAPAAAMMLDTKRTFDELVRRFSPDEEALERILGNPIYQNLTDALAGSREYSAMEKLHQLHSSGLYDLIVLDTPPSGHALDFLDAPRRLTGFLESQFLKLLFRPALAMGRTGLRIFRIGSTLVLRTLERISGLEFLLAISEFLLAFESMLEGFTARSREVEALLRDSRTGFLLIVGSESQQARRALGFCARLHEEGVHLLGVIVNRVRIWPDSAAPPDLDAETEQRLEGLLRTILAEPEALRGADRIARDVVKTLRRQASLARHDRDLCRELQKSLQLEAGELGQIPLFPEDVHAAESLTRMAAHIFKEDTSVTL